MAMSYTSVAPASGRGKSSQLWQYATAGLSIFPYSGSISRPQALEAIEEKRIRSNIQRVTL